MFEANLEAKISRETGFLRVLFENVMIMAGGMKTRSIGGENTIFVTYRKILKTCTDFMLFRIEKYHLWLTLRATKHAIQFD